MKGKKKKGFLIVAHGSRKAKANQQVSILVKKLRDYFQSGMFETAFMELARPDIETGIKALVKKGMSELVVFPYFLFNGTHSSKDVPDLVKKAIEKTGIKAKMLEPFGTHPAISNMVTEMLYDEAADGFEFKRTSPSAIEDNSMEIIENCLDGLNIPPKQKPVIKRVIHTTGDFDFLKSMVFHKDAVREGRKAIREKKTIYTDVTMVEAGIIKRFGHAVKCVLNEPEVIRGAGTEGSTRAAYGIKTLGHKLDGNIVAIGNAPTALIALVDMVKHEKIRPSLIVGIPVGFVNAKESKKYLTTLRGIPYITNRGQKGGSTVAAAILNALIKMEFVDKKTAKKEE